VLSFIALISSDSFSVGLGYKIDYDFDMWIKSYHLNDKRKYIAFDNIVMHKSVQLKL